MGNVRKKLIERKIRKNILQTEGKINNNKKVRENSRKKFKKWRGKNKQKKIEGKIRKRIQKI